MSDNARSLRLGVDVGGRFTDLVALSEGELVTAKIPSTPRDQSVGVTNAIENVRGRVRSGLRPRSSRDGPVKRHNPRLRARGSGDVPGRRVRDQAVRGAQNRRRAGLTVEGSA
jgi:Hydantoinase/oxoprolinase N-terminal region